MIPSEYGSSAPTSAKSLAQEVRDDEPAALEELRAVERAREQLELRELHRLVDVAEDAVDVGSGLDELGREPQRLRRRVRVLEAARVGHERRRRAPRRSRGVSTTPSSREEVADDLGGRGGVRDDEVDVAEARVVVMVVDVEHERARARAAPSLGRAGARSRSRRRAARARSRRRGARGAARRAVEEPVLGRERRVAGEVHHDVLAERSSPSVVAEQRAERVAVGVLVRDDDEAVVGADRLRDRLEVSRRRRRLIFGRKLARELVDQRRHPDAALDRRIVFEGQLRRPLQAELARDPRLHDAVRGLEAGEGRARACSRCRARRRRRRPRGGRA